jgi:uracil-DNA glycosylase
MLPAIPEAWKSVLSGETVNPSYQQLQDFVQKERQTHTVFPPAPEVFAALELTPLDQVRVLILGQDPYPGEGQAHGLSFSVRPGVEPPASLVNIFRELHDDVGSRTPNNGHLVPWARQGVLMLNAVLTVRAHRPNSHKGKGWEPFTDAIIRAVNAKSDRVVFVLWGAFAKKKAKLVDTSRHTIVEGAHPSPLSADKGFFGSKPFSKTNAALRAAGLGEINWQLPEL